MKAPSALVAAVLLTAPLRAGEVPVRHQEGRIHGFLVLRNAEGHVLASGVMTQSMSASRVTSELSFRFKDGSLQEETAVYAQRRTFQLLTYRLAQKGPSFKRPTDLRLNVSTGQVTIRYTEEDGKEKTISERMTLPPDLANGFVPTLLGNLDFKTPKTTVSMLVSTPKPRLVKLEISPDGEDSFSVGDVASKAQRYVVHVEIGGVSGVVAPLLGKQPPDTHVWMIGGKVPGFLKSEGPLFEGGPVWSIEMASPTWPKREAASKP